MRKILLASVAGLGALGAVSTASAQSANTPPMTSTGQVTGYSGGSFPKLAAPSPGTVVVRLNGRVRFYAGGAWDHDDQNTSPVSGAAVAPPINKSQDYGFIEYGRLYPGFDGVAANGLKYGANLEIRQNSGSAAGGGLAGVGQGGIYFRRVWGYLGTDALGTIRMGATDQPTSLYQTGTYENFNDGGWNGDVPAFIPGNLQPQWPFADTGAWYTTNKVVYLSPSLFGFDLGASYEPNTGTLSTGFNCKTGATGVAESCESLSSSPINSQSARRRNTFEVLLRYRGSFGPVGIAATGAYDHGAHVRDNSGVGFNNVPTFFTNPTTNVVTQTNHTSYKDLDIGDFGVALTFGGLSFGGHYLFGSYNGAIGAGLVPSGVANGDAWVAGASYTFGPTIIGAHWFVNETAGDVNNAVFGRRRREQGIAAGATYALAPGVSIYLSGLWGQRKQNGYDFVTGTGVTSTSGAAGTASHNQVTSSAVAVGTSFAW